MAADLSDDNDIIQTDDDENDNLATGGLGIDDDDDDDIDEHPDDEPAQTDLAGPNPDMQEFSTIYDVTSDENIYDPRTSVKIPSNVVTFTKPIKKFRYLSKYEYTRIKGLRLQQLAQGYPSHLSKDDDSLTFEQIFEKELNEKKLPFIIVRPIGNEYVEYYKLCDLEYLN